MQPEERSIETRLKVAIESTDLLSRWEQGFLESLNEQLRRRGILSERQIEILTRIEEQKLSEEAKTIKEQWIADYSGEKKRIAQICAEYYLQSGYYFFELAKNVANNPDFVPQERAWKKMCENKYAKKVVESHDTPAKYPIGSLVSFRSTAPWNARTLANGKPCVVLSTDGPITSSAKGGKPYKVLPFGQTVAIDCEERHLKKCREKKKKKELKHA